MGFGSANDTQNKSERASKPASTERVFFFTMVYIHDRDGVVFVFLFAFLDTSVDRCKQAGNDDTPLEPSYSIVFFSL